MSADNRKNVPDALHNVLWELNLRLKNLENVTSAVLFGSYSKGTYDKDSDVDVAVFVSSGESDTMRRTYHAAQRIASEYDYDIQILVFDRTALSQPVGIVEEIVTYGRDLSSL